MKKQRNLPDAAVSRVCQSGRNGFVPEESLVYSHRLGRRSPEGLRAFVFHFVATNESLSPGASREVAVGGGGEGQGRIHFVLTRQRERDRRGSVSKPCHCSS